MFHDGGLAVDLVDFFAFLISNVSVFSVQPFAWLDQIRFEEGYGLVVFFLSTALKNPLHRVYWQ